MHMSHELGRRAGESAILDGSMAGQLTRQRERTQRKAFLLELGTMIRLRSPYTVNVYGAITSLQDRDVYVYVNVLQRKALYGRDSPQIF
ncbi:unnamed protein product [Laminaria digitata]